MTKQQATSELVFTTARIPATATREEVPPHVLTARALVRAKPVRPGEARKFRERREGDWWTFEITLPHKDSPLVVYVSPASDLNAKEILKAVAEDFLTTTAEDEVEMAKYQ